MAVYNKSRIKRGIIMLEFDINFFKSQPDDLPKSLWMKSKAMST